jgi:hypothetical protein
MKPKFILIAALAALVTLLSGCMSTVDQMYCLPKRSEAFQSLQTAMDRAMEGLQYSAPLAGENQQTVQAADLNGDGKAEYIVFAKGNEDRPMRVLIFTEENGDYVLSSTIARNGSSFEQVEYVQMDGQPGLEMVVGCQVSDQVLRSVGVYRFDGEQAVRLVTANYSKFLTCDLDSDGLFEVMVLHPGQSETDNGVAELYGLDNGAIGRSNEAPISEPADKLKRIITGKLHDGVPAVFVGSSVEGSGIITDVYAIVDGVFTNVSLSNESGTSVQTLRNYYVYAADIDDDGVVELPDLITMPSVSQMKSAEQQYLIRWFAMKTDGSEVDKMYTFHNYVGGWYMKLDSQLAQWMSVAQNDHAFDFCLWDEEFQSNEKLFTVYAFTGQNREEMAVKDNRFVIYKDESTVYAAYLDVASAAYAITPEELVDSFHLIRQEWKTGVTE